MTKLIAASALAAALSLAAPASAQTNHRVPAPAIVLVHGQLDDAGSWTDLLTDLSENGYPGTTSYDLASAPGRRDDSSIVVRSVSAGLASIGGINAEPTARASTGLLLHAR